MGRYKNSVTALGADVPVQEVFRPRLDVHIVFPRGDKGDGPLTLYRKTVYGIVDIREAEKRVLAKASKFAKDLAKVHYRLGPEGHAGCIMATISRYAKRNRPADHIVLYVWQEYHFPVVKGGKGGKDLGRRVRRRIMGVPRIVHARVQPNSSW